MHETGEVYFVHTYGDDTEEWDGVFCARVDAEERVLELNERDNDDAHWVFNPLPIHYEQSGDDSEQHDVCPNCEIHVVKAYKLCPACGFHLED